MIEIIHILEDGTVTNDITGIEVPKEKCKQLYKIITDNNATVCLKEENRAS